MSSLVELATSDACQPLNFFRKLSPELKAEVDDYTLDKLPDHIIISMVKRYYMVDWVFRMSPNEATFIQKYCDDCEYFSIINYFEQIQPIYKEFFDATDYYKRYPEYLI